MVDAGDSKSPAARRAGSIPAPGTTFKSAHVQNGADFFFSPLKTGFLSSMVVRQSMPASGGTWGHIWGHFFGKWGHIAQNRRRSHHTAGSLQQQWPRPGYNRAHRTDLGALDRVMAGVRWSACQHPAPQHQKPMHKRQKWGHIFSKSNAPHLTPRVFAWGQWGQWGHRMNRGFQRPHSNSCRGDSGDKIGLIHNTKRLIN